jgi:hypothetical protein
MTRICRLSAFTSNRYISIGRILSVNCESRKTKLSVPGLGDYMLLKKDI